uniref:Putative odorant-binding protein n=1 Tax=Triatoma brasiliensis TaxID=65344 RepID=A0A162X358_TRIBS|nr:putative odorant-binding protein [Triatoma brasiliensis]
MSILYYIFVILATINLAHLHVVERRETEQQQQVEQTSQTEHEEVDFKGMTAKQIDELEENTYEDCRLKLNICKCFIEKYYSNDSVVPDALEFKKLSTCYSEKLGYVKGTKPNWERIRLSYEVYYHDNKEDLDKALKIVENCQKIPLDNLDANEVNYLLAKCTKEGYLEAGLEW